jgi:hypothetical protein
VVFLSSLSPAKSASEYPLISRESDLLYLSMRSFVPSHSAMLFYHFPVLYTWIFLISTEYPGDKS